MKKQIKTTLFLLLATVLTISSCKKEVTEEITNEYITNINGPMVYTYTQGNGNYSFTLSTEVHDWNIQENRLVELEIGELKEGDVVIIETQSRFIVAGTSCTGAVQLQTGSLLSSVANNFPNAPENIIPFGNGSSTGGLGWVESINEDENWEFIENTFIATIDSDIVNGYVSFWVSGYSFSSTCTNNEIICNGSSMVVSVYRNN